MSADKKQLRKEILDIRNNMSKEAVMVKSMRIYKTLTSLDEFKEASKIYTYVSVKNEVDTIMLMDHSFRNEKQVYVPKVNGGEMEFYEITDVTELTPGFFELYEPDVAGKEPDYSKKGLLIMPGIVFDKQLNRIGYGGGYYDKYLKTDNSFFKIALAYEYQVLEAIEADEHDMKPDMIITENKIYRL